MSDALCAVCEHRPVPDTTYTCPTCGDRLRALLTAVPGILDDLDDVIRRQVRFTDQPGARTQERPLPYNPAAAESRTVLHGTLAFWAGSIAEIRGQLLPAQHAEYLNGQVDWLRAQATGAEAFDELTDAIRQARRATDRPAERRYAGPCTAVPAEVCEDCGHDADVHRQRPDALRACWCGCTAVTECGTDLYARETGDTVTCPACGTEYPLAERRAWLLEQAQDRLLPAAELARAIDGLGVTVTKAMIAGWKYRGRLTPHTQDPDGRDLFRVGDVRALVDAGAVKRGVSTPHGGD